MARWRLTEIDLLLLHWPNPQVPLAETLGALARSSRPASRAISGCPISTVALIEEAVAACPQPLCATRSSTILLDQTKVRQACAPTAWRCGV